MKSWPLAAIICAFSLGAAACFIFGKTEGGMTLAATGMVVAIVLGTITEKRTPQRSERDE